MEQERRERIARADEEEEEEEKEVGGQWITDSEVEIILRTSLRDIETKSERKGAGY